MSLSAREQQALHSIEDGLAGSDPRLASLLATFTRLTAGEAMPLREKTRAGYRHATGRQRSWRRHPRPGPVSRNAHNMYHHLGWRRAGLLLWVLISIALIAIALVVNRGGSKGTCTGPWAMVCTRQATADAVWPTMHQLVRRDRGTDKITSHFISQPHHLQ